MPGEFFSRAASKDQDKYKDEKQEVKRTGIVVEPSQPTPVDPH